MRNQIIQAITDKSLIQYEYEGGIRIVEPHCFGITTAGYDAVRAFQIDGYSSTGKMGWKIFICAKISSLTILDKSFEFPRTDYKRGDKGMKTIYCEL